MTNPTGDYEMTNKQSKPEGVTFGQWFLAVDRLVYKMTGCSVHDLPDECFMDWYQAGVRPFTAAKRAIRNSGW